MRSCLADAKFLKRNATEESGGSRQIGIEGGPAFSLTKKLRASVPSPGEASGLDTEVRDVSEIRCLGWRQFPKTLGNAENERRFVTLCPVPSSACKGAQN